MSELENRIAAYLAHRMPGAGDIRVADLARIHGGSSQETFRFTAQWREQASTIDKRLILRRAPEAGLVVAERDLEFSVYSALAGTGVPVPAAHWLELDPRWLERPFFIMDLMPGKPGHFFGSDDPYEGQGEAVGAEFLVDHGQACRARSCGAGPAIAARRPRLRPVLAERTGALAGDPRRRRGTRRADRARGDPLAAAPSAARARQACRWSMATTAAATSCSSPTARSAPSSTGRCATSAIRSRTSPGRSTRCGRWNATFRSEDGLAIWEQASGLALDRDALEWWRLFVAVKACAIWTTAEASFQDGRSREPIVALTALRASHFHRKEILERMAQRGAMG